MPSNIEIKFRPESLAAIEIKAAEIADSGPVDLVQEDIFFNVSRGRLKLRKFADGAAELIAYCRSDSDQIRESNWEAVTVPDPDALHSALAMTVGEGVTVSKERKLYLIGSTRVHLDRVAGLGEFVELEVVLGDGDTQEHGLDIARTIVEKLGLEKSQRIAVAYADLLAENQGKFPAARLQ